MEIKICSIEGCERQNFSSNLCHMHYARKIKDIQINSPKRSENHGWGSRPQKPKCIFEHCNLEHYAKGYCRKHYAIFLLKGSVEYKKRFFQCQVDGCYNKGPYVHGYCYLHYSRFKAGNPLNTKLHETMRGERNPRWNEGTSEYPKHSEMKKVRKEVLREANNLCHYCGGYANEIHHKDLSKDNHVKENLAACCHKCNHLPEHRTSKFRRLYGHTYMELIAMKLFKNYYEIPVY